MSVRVCVPSAYACRGQRCQMPWSCSYSGRCHVTWVLATEVGSSEESGTYSTSEPSLQSLSFSLWYWNWTQDIGFMLGKLWLYTKLYPKLCSFLAFLWFKDFYFMYVCACTCSSMTCGCHSAYVEVRGQLRKLVIFFNGEFWGLNSRPE